MADSDGEKAISVLMLILDVHPHHDGLGRLAASGYRVLSGFAPASVLDGRSCPFAHWRKAGGEFPPGRSRIEAMLPGRGLLPIFLVQLSAGPAARDRPAGRPAANGTPPRNTALPFQFAELARLPGLFLFVEGRVEDETMGVQMRIGHAIHRPDVKWMNSPQAMLPVRRFSFLPPLRTRVAISASMSLHRAVDRIAEGIEQSARRASWHRAATRSWAHGS